MFIYRYCEINKLFSSQIKQLFHEIVIEGKIMNIIQIYNNLYIPNLKNFLEFINDSHQQEIEPININVVYSYFDYSGTFTEILFLIKEDNNKISLKTFFPVTSSILGNKRERPLASPPVIKLNQSIKNKCNSPFKPFTSNKNRFTKPKIKSKKSDYNPLNQEENSKLKRNLNESNF